MKSTTLGALLGLFSVVGIQVGQDLMTWTNWDATFKPQAVGRLLFIMATAVGSYQGGRLVQRISNENK